MLKTFRASKSNIVVWVLLVLLIIGLAGFGIGVSGGLTSSNVARVGERTVPAEEYVRALDQEMRAISGQLGRGLTIEEARQFGIDRVVLTRLVNEAALDNEAERLGISTGDDTVSEMVRNAPGFRGIDGEFDRDAYTFALERAGLSAAEFESQLRREATREVLAAGVQGAAEMPETAALTVLGFLGERRGFDWLRLTEADLEAPVPDPTNAEIAAEYDANPERYTRPETRRVTYATATPESVAAAIEIPEADLRAAYDAAPERFRMPERRIADRIAFRTMEDAAAAREQLDSGEIDFDGLVEARGLSAADTDQGELAAEDLEGAAREAVFGLEGPGIAGPVETPLGPSLFRVNAILAASETPFEEARVALAEELTLAEAQRQIIEQTATIDDLIAGGAGIEEIASETLMQMGEVALNSETTDAIAGDPAFVELAEAARFEEVSDLAELDGGGLVTLRIDAIEEPVLLPLGEVRDRVVADWRVAQVGEALTEHAEVLTAAIGDAEGLAGIADEAGLAVETAAPMSRGEVLPSTPPRLVADIFEVEAGEAVIVADGAEVLVAQLTGIEPYDPDENAAVQADLRRQFDAQAADDLLMLFTAAVRDAAGVRTNQDMIDAALAQFP